MSPPQSKNLYQTVAERVISEWRMARVQAGRKESDFEKVRGRWLVLVS